MSSAYGARHRDCANFSNGICLLTGVAVDPEGPACPRFMPKTALRPAYPYPQPLWYAQPQPLYHPMWGYPYPRRAFGYGRLMRRIRRRMRRRLGW